MLPMSMLTFPFVLFFLAIQASPVPDVQLAISFREKAEGQALRQPIYILEVSCRDGECSYTYVSLNDCGVEGTRRRAFFPKVQGASTTNGDVKVTNEGDVLTLVHAGTDSFGDWVNTFRIGYQATRDGSPATRTVSFSGDFVKTSELIRVPTRIEYIPLEGPFQEIDLECPLLAPGVDQ
jgi:hypothetical protein